MEAVASIEAVFDKTGSHHLNSSKLADPLERPRSTGAPYRVREADGENNRPFRHLCPLSPTASFFPDCFEQDFSHFLHGLRVLIGSMAGWHDLFGLRTLQMRTRVRNHAIAAVGRVPAAAVSDDGVIGDSTGERQFLDR